MLTVTIPGYRIVRPIASGSSATVYLAVQEDLNREVALKVLAPGLFDAEETRVRFLREARLQAGLRHPNLVEVFVAGFAGAHPYLVTELVDGGSLHEWIYLGGRLGRPFPRDELGPTPRHAAAPLLGATPRHAAAPLLGANGGSGGPPAAATALRIVRELASGVACAHTAGVIHRDLKPANVLLTRGGQAKVGDFGLARSVGRPATVQTRHGVLLGTPGYMAPETIRGERAGAPADVYALGVILFECLTGALPFRGSTPAELFSDQARGRPLALSSFLDEAPAGLPQLIDSCLRPESGDRPTARSVADTLKELDGAPLVPLRTGASGADRRVARGGAHAGRGMAPGTAGGKIRRPRSVPPWVGWTAASMGSVLLLAVGLSWTFREPPPPSTMRPVDAGNARGEASEGTAPAGLPPPPLPEIVSLDVGARAARLELASAAGENAWWVLTPQGPAVSGEAAQETQPVTVALALTPGERVHTALGLEPGWRYSLELRGGEASRLTTFDTLATHDVSRATLMARGHRRIHNLNLTGRGDRVFLFWRRTLGAEKQVVEFRESRDGGLTWGPTVRVPESPAGLSFIRTAILESGLLFTWQHRRSGRAQSVYWFRRRADGSWRNWTQDWAISAPAALDDAGDEIGLLRWRRGDPELSWSRWDLARGDGPPASGVPVLPALPDLGSVHLLRVGERISALLRREPAGSDIHDVLWTSTTTPDEAPWPEPRMLAPGDVAEGRRSSLTAGLGKVIYADASAEEIFTRASHDGGSTFQPARRLRHHETGDLSQPALTYDEHRFYLAGTARRMAFAFKDVLFWTSEDGESWELLDAQFAFISLVDLAIVPVDGGLLLAGRDELSTIVTLRVPLEAGRSAAGTPGGPE